MLKKLSIIILFSIYTSLLSSPAFATENDYSIDNEGDIWYEVDIKPVFITSSYQPQVNRVSAMQIPKMVLPTDDGYISSGYGYRKSSCSACSSNHKGVDFAPGKGEPVYAAMDGIVSRIEYGYGFGQHVYIEHIANFNDDRFEDWKTIYAHLEIGTTPKSVRVGSVVKAGDLIGTVGNTGISTGAHLHFELIVDGENVDPQKYLKMYQVPR